MKQIFIVLFCLITFWSTGICQENYFKILPMQNEESAIKESFIVTANEGDLEKLLFFYKSYYYRLVMSFSNDGGDSWSKPDTIDYLGENNSDIQALVTNTGRILLTYFRFYYRLRYSDDGGLNWSPYIILPTGTAGNSSFIQLPDNRICFIYTQYSQLKVIYSNDDGASWSSSSNLFPFSVRKG